MSSTELILNMLAEVATKDITNATNPYGLEENRQAARDGGKIAGNARKEIEEHTGKAVITSQINPSVLTFPMLCAAGLGKKNTPLVSQRGIKDYNVLI